jgi:hypothetical protein
MEQGIESISLNPDTVIETWRGWRRWPELHRQGQSGARLDLADGAGLRPADPRTGERHVAPAGDGGDAVGANAPQAARFRLVTSAMIRLDRALLD